MPNLWERTHETVLDNELRKAAATYRREVVHHGRMMFVIGFVLGTWLTVVVTQLL